jgi:hypothetical protein
MTYRSADVVDAEGGAEKHLGTFEYLFGAIPQESRD